MLTRRAFFSLLGGGAVALADPEKCLWVPGARLISIPAPRVRCWSVTEGAWAIQTVRNHLLSGQIEALFCPPYWPKIGDTINLRIPRRFVPYDPDPWREDFAPVTRIA
jgi:hypothetical protein